MAAARIDAVPEVVRTLTSDIMTPLVSKNFAAKELAPFIDALPAYATGGMRISFPFGGRRSLSYGISVPGTRGLGRRAQIVAKDLPGIRKMGKALEGTKLDRVAEVIAGIKPQMDVQGYLLKAVKQGRIDGYQYLQVIHALDDHLLQGPMQLFTAKMNKYQQTITDMFSKEFDLDAQDRRIRGRQGDSRFCYSVAACCRR